jgi:hypothetical protein
MFGRTIRDNIRHRNPELNERECGVSPRVGQCGVLGTKG